MSASRISGSWPGTFLLVHVAEPAGDVDHTVVPVAQVRPRRSARRPGMCGTGIVDGQDEDVLVQTSLCLTFARIAGGAVSLSR